MAGGRELLSLSLAKSIYFVGFRRLLICMKPIFGVNIPFRDASLPNNELYVRFPMAFFTYLTLNLSAEQKCLVRRVPSAVLDGIRSDLSIYSPPSLSSPSLTRPNLLLPFQDGRKPSGAWRTPSRLTLSRGNVLGNMWGLWFKCTPKELWSFPRLPFLLQIRTMTVKPVNRQMYDNHFPQAHYCSAHGRRTRFIIMPLPLLQLWWFATILVTYSLGYLDHVNVKPALQLCKSSPGK